MDSEEEADVAGQSSTTNIPILPLIFSPSPSSVSAPPSPEPSGTAAVPFRWEKEPGKPKQSTAIVPFTDSSPKSLELPPRLVPVETPTHGSGSSNRFRSPSSRIGSDRYGSFRSDRGRIPARAVVRSRRWLGFGVKRRWFGSWRMKKREVNGGSYVFPSCGSDHRETSNVDAAIGGTRKNRAKIKNSGLWGRIWEGLKQMGAWKSKTVKEDEYAFSVTDPLTK